jgi:hypothetical protein
LTLEYEAYIDCVVAWFRIDCSLHDISPLELSCPLNFLPKANIQLGVWDNAECMINTNFSDSILQQIYDLFALQNIANQQGYICIPTGGRYQRGVLCHYQKHAEELFLFFVTILKK